MKKILIVLIAILLLTSLANASYNDLDYPQKTYYWDCLDENQCFDFLNAKEYTPWRKCSVNCYNEAIDYSPSANCEDTEEETDYFVKGEIVSFDFPKGKEDYCYTENTLFDYACKGESWVRYQKDCKEIGDNYGCQNGACVILNHKPVMNPVNDKEVNEGSSLTYTVSSTDADGDELTHEVLNLPDGAEFNENIFSFNPDYEYLDHATYTFKKTFYLKFRAFDGEHYSDWSNTKVTVKDMNRKPVLQTVSNKEINAGEDLNFKLMSVDQDNDEMAFHAYWCLDADFSKCVFGSENYPEGMSFDKESGDFIWETSSEQAGVYGIKFYVYDKPYAEYDEKNVLITIKDTSVLGCTDQEANNYNQNANVDDGSCTYEESTWTEHHTTIENKDRMYLVFEPAECKSSKCPLLISFHGHGSNPNSMKSYSQFESTAEQNGFILVMPNSLDNLPGKDIEFFGQVLMEDYDLVGKKWDIAHVLLPLEERYWSQDVDFTETIINEVNSEYDVNLDKVFTTGHSYGALFSYYVATSLPNKIKAFGVHSGGLYEYFGMFMFPIPPRNINEYSTPGIVIYSPGDKTVPPETSQALVQELENAGQVVEEVVLSSNIGHGWDASKNQQQWDFFMDNS
jgi:predicted esterase